MPHMQQKHHSAGIFMIVGQLVAIVFLFGCLKLSAYSTFPMNIRRRCMNNCAMGARRLVSSSSSSKGMCRNQSHALFQCVIVHFGTHHFNIGRISSSLSSQSSESKAPFTQPPKVSSAHRFLGMTAYFISNVTLAGDTRFLSGRLSPKSLAAWQVEGCVL